MKITWQGTPAIVDGQLRETGQDYDVPDHIALELVQRGMAQLPVEDAPIPVPDPLPLRTRRGAAEE